MDIGISDSLYAHVLEGSEDGLSGLEAAEFEIVLTPALRAKIWGKDCKPAKPLKTHEKKVVAFTESVK